MDKKFLGMPLKYWLIGGALAVGIGLYLRSKSNASAQTPAGKAQAVNPGGRTIHTRTTVTRPGRVIVVRRRATKRHHCRNGYHWNGHRCVKTKTKAGKI